MASALEVATLYGLLDLRDDATGKLDRAERRFSGFQSTLDTTGAQMQRVGGGLTTLTAPLLAFGLTGIRTASQFDASMNMISARTGIVGQDLQDISDYAQRMGAETVFSSQQAADAFLELLTSGSSASEAMAQLPQVLNLAAAGNLELGRAADIVTDVMAIYGIEAENANEVTDALARAAASSSANVQMLGDAMANGGGKAASMGLSVEETAAILAIFAENGIKGSEAGTQLRSLLTNMTRTTEATTGAWNELGVSLYDANGDFRAMDDILNETRVAMDALPMEDQIRLSQDIAGSYGIMGFQALLASEGVEAMQETMNAQADAAAVAGMQMRSFKQRVNSLMGSIEALQIAALTPLMNQFLSPLVGYITSGVNALTTLIKTFPELGFAVTTSMAALATVGPALLGLGTMATMFAPILPYLGLIAALTVGIGVATFVLRRAWHKNWGGIQQTVGIFATRFENAMRVTNDAFEFFQHNVGLGVSTFGALTGAIRQYGTNALYSLGFSRELAETISNGLVQALLLAKDIVDNWPSHLSDLWGRASVAAAQLGAIVQYYLVAGLNSASVAASQLGAIVQFYLVSGLNKASVAASQLGIIALAYVVPVLNLLNAIVTTIADAFMMALPHILHFGVGLAMLGTVVVPVLALAGGVYLLANMGTILAAAWGILNAALMTGVGAFAFLLSPVFLLTAALVGLLLAIEMLYPGGIAQMFMDASLAAQQLSIIFMALLVGAINSVNSAVQTAATNWSLFVEILKGLWDKAGAGVQALASGITSALQPVMDFLNELKTLIDSILQGIAGIQAYQGVGSNASAIGGMVASGEVGVGDVARATWSTLQGNYYGGAVTGPSRVGEYNTPELLMQGGKQYLIPGDRGRIVPGAHLGGGGGATINVSVVGSDAYDVAEMVARELRNRGL